MSLKNRYEFVLLFDVKDGNPNGDPDAGNMPRVDPETNHGLVTDVCLKRKVRNFTAIAKKNLPGFDIYVAEKAVLTSQRKKSYEALGLENNPKYSSEAKAWMCKNFFDVRAFGAVMGMTGYNCGQVRGPVQMTFARSIDPIISSQHSITRMAVEEKDAKKQSGENQTMGSKFTIPYALYRENGFLNPFFAADTGFSDADAELFFDALKKMFDFDRSAARGLMATQKLIVFKHASQLGNAPAHVLFDAVKVVKKEGVEYPRSYSDYEVTIDKAVIPEGVEVIEM